MKDEQQVVGASATAADRGDAPPSKKRKWRALESRIQRLKSEYANGQRNLNEYWDSVVHIICAFV